VVHVIRNETCRLAMGDDPIHHYEDYNDDMVDVEGRNGEVGRGTQTGQFQSGSRD
jgi:hypothetical protein